MDIAPITVERHSTTATIALAGEDRANFLDEPTLARLSEATISVIEDPAVETICFCSRGRNFLSGVDVACFARAQADDDLQCILAFTRSGHRLLNMIGHSPKPVIAWVQGIAAGAGLELALASHEIVAGPNAKFCFPETGLGIYPGLGGTQRLPRRVGVGLAKWMIYTGAIVPAQHALEIGLVDAICLAAKDVEQAVESLASAASTRGSLSPRFHSLEELFSRHDLAALFDPAFQITDPVGIRALVQLRGKARLALRLAEQIIDRGMQLRLDQGIEEEFRHLLEVFSSDDARQGMTLANGQRPRFTGQ